MTTSVWDTLQKSLEGLRKDCPDGFTSDEFADHMECSHNVARGRMRKLFQKGTIKLVGNRQVTRMDGRVGYAPVYNLTKASKK